MSMTQIKHYQTIPELKMSLLFKIQLKEWTQRPPTKEIEVDVGVKAVLIFVPSHQL